MTRLITGLGVVLVVPVLQAQTQTSDTAAASGMTTGLPGVSTARQAEMMQIRARAQAAKPDAEQAAMERSADDALAKQSHQRLIDEAREIKSMKEQAARQLEHQKAANAYRAVTAGEISSWADDSGRVKVERCVPPEILASLPPEEEASPVAEEPTGFNPLKAPKKAMQGAARAVGGATGAVTGAAKKGVSWIPGVGKKVEMETGITATPRSQPEPSPVASDGGDSGGGMLSKIPLIGGIGHRGDRAVEPEPTVATASVPAESGEKTGFMKGLTSKIPFVGKKDEGTEGGSSQEAVASVGGVNDGATAAPPVPPVAMGDGGVGDGVTAPPFMGPQSAQPMASEGGSVGVPSEEKSGGMFGGFKGLV
ncbi:MAG: hypothetical protein KDL87_17180, partial [Verrucomicrobiae bacterium]|nr:hypothetical protein [Verrucomicrobiae bacterium]